MDRQEKYRVLSEEVSVGDILTSLKTDGALTLFAHPFWLTHPGRGGFAERDIWEHIDAMLAIGVDRIEVFNTANDAGFTEALLHFCRERGLPAAGGSDSHGLSRIEQRDIPDELLTSMKWAHEGRKAWEGGGTG